MAANLDTLDRQLNGELLPLARRGAPADSLQAAFLRCRLTYKRVEAFTTYFMPGTARLFNGPPLPEVEVAENKTVEPGGFQVMEPLLFPQPTPEGRPQLLRELTALGGNLRRVTAVWEDVLFTDSHVFDALRQHTWRVVALGITGFDTPLCQQGLPETAASLAAVRQYMRCYAGRADSAAAGPRLARLLASCRAAEAYLRGPVSFDDFDRMHFIRTYANPVSEQMLALQQQLGILPFADELRPFRADAGNLFSANAFQPDYYAGNKNWHTNKAKVELGRRLFHDALLSGGAGRSCASCHQPGRAFTDGLTQNATLGGGTLRRNTPTILNAALQAGQFYDLRAPNLENQVVAVVSSADEMHGSLASAATTLLRQPDYARSFAQAFAPASAGQPLIDAVRIQNALAAYERSLVSLNAPFDRYARGEAGAMLSPAAVRGFNLYAGRAKCATCHFLPLTNGTVPPTFTMSEVEVLGVPERPGSGRLDPDLGRYLVAPLPQLRNAFKTPTLRNVALTAPYMHNGQYRTLEEVIEFYNQGGGLGLGIAVENQTLPPDKLHLTPRDVADLKAFMVALTDTGSSRKPRPALARR